MHSEQVDTHAKTCEKNTRNTRDTKMGHEY